MHCIAWGAGYLGRLFGTCVSGWVGGWVGGTIGIVVAWLYHSKTINTLDSKFKGWNDHSEDVCIHVRATFRIHVNIIGRR